MGVADTLTLESIRISAKATSRKGVVAAVVQLLLFPAMVLSSHELRSEWVAWFGYGCMVLSAIIRFVSNKKIDQYLVSREGHKKWEAIFLVSAQLISLGWSMTTAYSIVNDGLTAASIKALIAALGTVAITASSYPFDLRNNFMFQVIMMVPIAAAMAINAGGSISFAALLYLAYGLHVGHSAHKTELELMRKTELLATQHDRLKENHEFIQTMLSSIDESFVVVNKEGVIAGAASGITKTYFGRDPEGTHLADLLRFEGPARENFAGWYRLLYEPNLDFKDTVARGPKQLELENGVILKLKYHPLRDEKEVLQSIVFTATDVTKEIRAQRSLDQERERAELILRIHENRASFRPFLSDCETTFDRMCRYDGSDLDGLKRELHTLKGTAMIFGAAALGREVYASELVIRETQPGDLIPTVKARGEILLRFFIAWRVKEMNLFTQLGVFEDDMIEISRRKLRAIEDSIQDQAKREQYQQFSEQLLSNEFGDLMRDFEFHVNSLAVKLGKKVRYSVAKPAVPVVVPLNAYREILRSLVHLINNGVDHGIETPAERIASGKPAEGSIVVSYEMIEEKGTNYIRLNIQDDGKGINVAKVRESVTKKGRDVSAKSDLEVAMHIFDDGLSTREQVTEISGQGVGMGSVKASVLKARGKIRVARTDSTGTLFEILIPEKKPVVSLRKKTDSKAA